MTVSLIGSTTSALVSGTFYVVLCWKRDALMTAFFIGAISNGILSKILKRVINQQRPEGLETAASENNIALKPSDGGMPSSHAMSLGYIGTFTALHVPWTPLPLLLYVVVSLWYRVQVQLHTPAQISVGLLVGTGHALLFDAYAKESLMTVLRNYILDTNGLLPVPLLIIPALVGALVVGSVERRLSRWLKTRKVKE